MISRNEGTNILLAWLLYSVGSERKHVSSPLHCSLFLRCKIYSLYVYTAYIQWELNLDVNLEAVLKEETLLSTVSDVVNWIDNRCVTIF